MPHDIFHVPEILSMIMETLADPQYGREFGVRASSDLGNLACVCRSFFEPAIDILWRAPPTMLPLLRCFPTTLLQPFLNAGVIRHSLQRPLQASDWVRFDMYAQRIHLLGPVIFSEKHSKEVRYFPDSILHGLKARPIAVSSIFRRLEGLDWSDTTHGLWPIHVLLTKSLRTIRISLDPSVKASSQLLASLPLKCPNIKDALVTAEVDSESGNISEAMANCVAKWPKIQAFRCRIPLDAETLLPLASSESLTDLEVTVNLPQQILPSLVASPFKSLRSLTLRSAKPLMMDLVHLIMDAVPTGQLVSIDLDYELPIYDTAAFVRLLQRFGQHHHLRSFSIAINVAEPVHADDLVPLHSLHDVETVLVDIRGGFSIGDDDLATMATAWPRLRDINFGRRSYLGRSKITLMGLLPLLGGCPRLNAINLDLDAGSPVLNLGPETPINGSVQTLAVGVSRISNSDNVVKFILRTMPGVTGINHAWGWGWRADTRTEQQIEFNRRWSYVNSEIQVVHQEKQFLLDEGEEILR